ncbi:MAG: hypothetical protein V2B19_01705 [Pseudomonadota bacterium]
MFRNPFDTRKRRLTLLIMGIFTAAVIAAALTLWQRKQPPTASVPPVVESTPVPKPEPPVVAFDATGDGEISGDSTEKRKAEFGFDKGIDLIVRPDETLKIGDTTVPMQEILDRIRLQKGDIVEKSIQGANESSASGSRPTDPKRADAYGIYVVQPADNIWNVHFRFLRDFFQHRGIRLSPASDEPDRHGASSGVGKILKFSESMVTIYNLREKKLDVDLNLIHPLTKIVIFDMKQTFSLLGQIDYDHVNHIQYDGKTLWIPSKQ